MKRFLIIVSALVIATTINAQKLYSTKTGKITFESKAPLEDIEATNSEVESKLLASNGQVVFTLLMKGFQFENQLMEDHFNENYVESSKFPKASFKGYVTNIKDINFDKDGTYPAKVKGELTIHGVTKEVQSDGSIVVKNGKVVAKSKFPIKVRDYNITIPKVVGNKIAETITINVDCHYE